MRTILLYFICVPRNGSKYKKKLTIKVKEINLCQSKIIDIFKV